MKPETLYRRSWRGLQSRDQRLDAKSLRAFDEAALPAGLAIRAAATDDEPVEILLYDEIGYWGVTAKDFVLALAGIGADKALRVRINSPGGDVFDGVAIYNALQAHKGAVVCVVDGVAASIASVIACAGATLEMAEQSMLMIHNAWGVVVGNKADMLATAEVMAKIDGQIAAVYAHKTGKPATDFVGLMDAETWLTRAEAVESGFCAAEAPTPSTQARLVRAPRALADPERASARIAARLRAELPAYDPDGDGDNDAAQALGHIRAAAVLLEAAADCLTGRDVGQPGEPAASASASEENTGQPPGNPVVPGARAAATEAEWVVGAATDLPVDKAGAWDGPAAAERMLDAAGFNGNSPDPAKAKRGFLVWDHHNPNLKGSYKLPFADLVDGELTALKSGVDAAASRLPDTDIPASAKARARDVLDEYEKRMGGEDKEARARAARRLKLAEAEGL